MANSATPALKKKKTPFWKTEAFQGYLFVTPYLIAFTIFTGIPFISAFVLSFTNVKFISKLDNLKFVGFKNFIRFFSSSEAMAALGRSALYTLIYVPVIMVLAFVLAYLLNKGVFWAKGIRSMFFLPYISNMVAVAVVFQLLLGPRGPFYLLQKFFGSADPILPLLNQKWALPAVVLISVWKGIGLNFLTYLGALQGVDKSLIEAAEIDGANKWQQIRHITLPSLLPMITVMLLLSVGNIMRSDTGLFYQVTRNSGVLYSTTQVIDSYVLNSIFKNSNFGFTAATTFFQSVVGLFMMLLANGLVRKIAPENALF